MQSMVYAMPILPGKTEEVRRLFEEAKGRRRDVHEDSRQRMGVAREMEWIQKMPGMDWLIAYLEADDIDRANEVFMSAREPYDTWYKQQLKYATGMDYNAPMPGGAGPEVIYEPDPGVKPAAKALAAVFPILPGKTGEMKEWLSDYVDPRTDRIKNHLRMIGLSRQGFFLQRSPDGDYIFLYAEGDDPAASLKRLAESDDPNMVDFRHHMTEYIGMDYEHMPVPPEMVFSWEDKLRAKAA